MPNALKPNKKEPQKHSPKPEKSEAEFLSDAELLEKSKALTVFDPLQKYFSEIRNHPLLEKEEEFALAERYFKNKDKYAAFKLASSNLRLVVKIALEYQHTYANLLDLIQEGNIGLLKAVKKFNPYRGIRLSSYAQWWIRAYILKFLMDNFSLVKLGTTQAQRKLFFNLNKEKLRLERMGYSLQPKLLAESMNVKVKEVLEMNDRLRSPEYSLDAPFQDEKGSLIDVIPKSQKSIEDILISQDLRSKFQNVLDKFETTLNDKERIIWKERILNDEPKTLSELGDKFAFSRERARQYESRIKDKLREFLKKSDEFRDEFKKN